MQDEKNGKKGEWNQSVVKKIDNIIDKWKINSIRIGRQIGQAYR